MQQLMSDIANQSPGATQEASTSALTAQLETAVQGLSQGLVERDTEVHLDLSEKFCVEKTNAADEWHCQPVY